MFNCDNCGCEPDTLYIVKINGKKYCVCPDCKSDLRKNSKEKNEEFKRDYCAICCDGGNCLGCEL